jgi:DNA-binding NarL/FixJ family response regulator
VLPEEFDELSPKEELYYQKPPFSTNEVFLGSKGGVSQLVDHGPSGVRQGYANIKASPWMDAVANRIIDYNVDKDARVFISRTERAAGQTSRGIALKGFLDQNQAIKFANATAEQIEWLSEKSGVSKTIIKNAQKKYNAIPASQRRNLAMTKNQLAWQLERVDLQKKILERVNQGDTSIKQIAKNLKLSVSKVEAGAETLFNNVNAEKLKINKGLDPTTVYLPASPSASYQTNTKKLNEVRDMLWKVDGFEGPEGRSWFKLIRDARESGRITTKQFKTATGNVKNFFRMKHEIAAKYPNIILNLDHPLSFGAIENLGASGEKFLTGMPSTETFNKGIKQRLDNKYASVIENVKKGISGSAKQKIAIEKLAKNLNIDIGEISPSGKKIVSLGKKSIVLGEAPVGKSILEAIEAQNVLAKKIKNIDPALTTAAGMEKYFKKVNLPETSKKELRGLAKLICGLGGSAEGGRIGFQVPGRVGGNCVERGIQKIKTGNIATKSDAAIMKKIVQAGAKKGAARTAMIWLGPLGLGGDVLLEAGDIATQMLGGKSLGEALRNNWITGMFTEGTEKEFRDITKVFPKTGPGAEKFVAGTAEIEKLNRMKNSLAMMIQRQKGPKSKITDEQVNQLRADVERQENYVKNLSRKGVLDVGSAGEEEYRLASREVESTDPAKSWATQQRLKYELDPPQSDRYKSMNIDISRPSAMPKEKRFDTPQKQAEAFMRDKEGDPLDPKEFGFENIVDFYNNYRKSSPEFNEYVIKTMMSPEWGDVGTKGTGDSFFRGTYERPVHDFARGGLTRTVAPDSGSVSRGLRSLYIDDMD